MVNFFIIFQNTKKRSLAAADTIKLPTTFTKKFTELKKFKEETLPTTMRVLKKRLEGILSH